jgi:hypothetical protein
MASPFHMRVVAVAGRDAMAMRFRSYDDWQAARSTGCSAHAAHPRAGVFERGDFACRAVAEIQVVLGAVERAQRVGRASLPTIEEGGRLVKTD